MGTSSREIKSPENEKADRTPLAAGGGARAGSHNTCEEASSGRRKKLGIYFIESDDRRTALAGGYVAGGTTPVNIHGKPISDLSKTGGWKAAAFIFG